MKKFLTILWPLFIICFPTCTPKQEKPTLVILSSLWNQPQEKQFIQDTVIKEFERKFSCTINFINMEDKEILNRVHQEQNKLITDIVIAHGGRFADWFKTGYLADLLPLIKTWQDRTPHEYFNYSTSYGGKQYFFPICADVHLTCINKKALKYLPEGVDIDTISWHNFKRWVNAVAAGEGSGKLAFTGVPGNMFIYQFGCITLSFGGDFPDITSSAALRSWELLIQMRDAFSPALRVYDNVVPAMIREEVWFSVTHCARVGQIYMSHPDQFIVAPAPQGDAGIGSIYGVSGLAVVKGAPHRELSQKFIEYITRPRVLTKVSLGTGGFIPTVKEYRTSLGDNSHADIIIATSLKMLDTGNLRFVPSHLYTDWSKVKLLFDDIFHTMILNKGMVDKAYLNHMAVTLKNYEKK